MADLNETRVPASMSAGRPCRLPRRAWLGVGLLPIALASTLALGGCSLFSASKPKPEPLPQLRGTASLTVAWSRKIGRGGVDFQPAYAGGSVWAASQRGRLVRIEAATGKLLWDIDVGQELLSGVGTDGSVAVVAARDGSLIAFDADGKRKWSINLASEAVAVPAVGEGVVLARTSNNRVTAIDAQSGRQRWSNARQNPSLVLHQTSLMTIDAGIAYVGVPGGRLAALALDSGAVRWEAAVSQPRGSNEIERISDVVGAVPVVESQACAVSYQGRLACFEAASGRPTWVRDVASSTGVAMNAGMLAVSDSSDQVQAFSRTGGSLWRNQLFKLRQLSAPLITDDGVVVGDGNGLVHGLDRDDGAAIARAETDGSPIVSIPIQAGALTIVQTAAGGVYALAFKRR